jgi:hypothetical protein
LVGKLRHKLLIYASALKAATVASRLGTSATE